MPNLDLLKTFGRFILLFTVIFNYLLIAEYSALYILVWEVFY